MDPVQIFKQRMIAAIQVLPDNTPEGRAAIYRKTREFVAFSRFANLGGALETAISQIEEDFNPQPEPAENKTARAEGRLARWTAPLAGAPRAVRAMLAGLSLRMRLTLATGLAAVIGLATAALLLKTPPSDPDFDRGFRDYSSSARGFEPIPSWTSYYAAGKEGDVTFVEGKGTAPLYSKEVFPVAEGKAYTVSARVRVIKDDPADGGSTFMVGTVSYDRRGKPIGAEIAPAQYFVMNQKLIKAAQGWVTGEGTIIWNGADPNLSFPAGTVSVRLVAILNNASPDAVAQIDYLRIQPAKN